MAFRWRADNGPTLNADLAAWIRTSTAKEPFIFVVLQGEGVSPLPPLPPRFESTHGLYGLICKLN